MSENSLSLDLQTRTVPTGRIPLLSREGGSGWPSLGHGAIWNRQKRLLRQLVLLSNRSFSFVKLEGKVGSRQEEGGIWDDLKASLEKVSGGLEAPPLGKADNLPAVRKHLQRLSQEKPLLILLENAQWMDAASFNKVKQLEEKSSGERWQLIVTAEGPLPEFLLTFFGSLKSRETVVPARVDQF